MSSANISICLELDGPANLSARDVTESSFTVSWEPAQAQIDGYIIIYSSSEGFSGEIPVEPGSTSYMLTNLRPGVLYTVFIWAIKGNKASKKISTQAETGLLFVVKLSSLTNPSINSNTNVSKVIFSDIIYSNYLFWLKKSFKHFAHVVN